MFLQSATTTTSILVDCDARGETVLLLVHLAPTVLTLKHLSHLFQVQLAHRSHHEARPWNLHTGKGNEIVLFTMSKYSNKNTISVLTSTNY